MQKSKFYDRKLKKFFQGLTSIHPYYFYNKELILSRQQNLFGNLGYLQEKEDVLGLINRDLLQPFIVIFLGPKKGLKNMGSENFSDFSHLLALPILLLLN